MRSNTSTAASQSARNATPNTNGGHTACATRRALIGPRLPVRCARSGPAGAARNASRTSVIFLKNSPSSRVVIAASVAEVDRDHIGDAARPRRHHDDAVRQVHGLWDRVRDEHHRRAGLGTDAQQLGLHVLAGHLVERPERLVHQQQRRMRRERPWRSRPAAASHPTAATAGDRRTPPSLTSSSISRGAVGAPLLVPPLELERQLDVLGDAAPVEQPGLLERHAVLLVDTRLVRDLAVDGDRAGGRGDQIGDQPEQRRLATPRRSDQ